jgi:hypothetical protein
MKGAPRSGAIGHAVRDSDDASGVGQRRGAVLEGATLPI